MLARSGLQQLLSHPNMVEVCRTKYCHVTHDEKNTISRELKRKKKTDSGIFIVPNA
ncbi:hypothetical protein N8619_01085 [Akkermansiaceae bacterium]|nr:hypothetical protein [Akkermansiaceae bacterium]